MSEQQHTDPHDMLARCDMVTPIYHGMELDQRPLWVIIAAVLAFSWWLAWSAPPVLDAWGQAQAPWVAYAIAALSAAGAVGGGIAFAGYVRLRNRYALVGLGEDAAIIQSWNGHQVAVGYWEIEQMEWTVVGRDANPRPLHRLSINARIAERVEQHVIGLAQDPAPAAMERVADVVAQRAHLRIDGDWEEPRDRLEGMGADLAQQSRRWRRGPREIR